ncbi:alginate lyase family protein [Boseongicola aestuarii]|uniref:Alginate lyase n=1 Tax=Boseongicola aestuarii TaxID=1470561 RepID=A0A238IZW5_9RHOB|nr:alginate lyase family protein [Boseongicola aestuarii]SMX24018.1 Alginate lyase precursor [Boseongicola aestuarii]
MMVGSRLKELQLSVFSAAMIFSGSNAVWASGEEICDAAPPAVVSLNYQSRYADSDDARAEIDPEREAEVLSALKPLDAFVDALAFATSGLYEGSAKAREARAACLVDQLGAWAAADALSDLSTVTAKLTIGSRYSAFSMVLWQTLPYAPDHPERANILKWLEKRLDEQVLFWADAPSGAREGNLRAWAALAAASLAEQTNRRDLRDWAEASIREVMCTAEADGSLPQEMSRGRFALHYQLHAIAPLVTSAVFLERQGVRATEICNAALHRIVHFAMSDLADGSKTAAKTGEAQSLFDGTDHLTSFQLAWIEQYLLLKRTETLEATAEALRPLIYTKLGGNQTDIWK